MVTFTQDEGDNMPVTDITTNVTGVVSVVPRLVYIKSNDSFLAMQAVGYLNQPAAAFGFVFTNNDFAAVYSTQNGMAWAQVVIGIGGLITLVFVTDYPSEQSWQNVTTASIQMKINTGYTCNAGASLITFTLPLTSTYGDFVKVNGFSVGGWKIAQNANQSIRFNSLVSTTGVTGFIASLTQYDSIELRCVTPNMTWSVFGSEGSITVS